MPHRDAVHACRSTAAVARHAREGHSQIAGVGNQPPRLAKDVVDLLLTSRVQNPNAKVVPLLPEVAEVLRARRQQMVTAQHPGLVEGWIFPTEKGKLYKGRPLRKVLEDALAARKIDRRVTPHGLRHTAELVVRGVA
jgi:integrase